MPDGSALMCFGESQQVCNSAFQHLWWKRDDVHQAVRASIIKLLLHIYYLFPIHFSLREGVRSSFLSLTPDLWR